MASRRYRAKNSLNSNVSQVNAQVNKMGKRPAPRKIADEVITTSNIKPAAVVTELINDGAVDNKKLAVDAVATDNIRDAAVTENKISTLTATKLSGGTINATSNVVISANVVTSGTLPSTVTVNASSVTGPVANATYSATAGDAVTIDGRTIYVQSTEPNGSDGDIWIQI